MVLLAVSRTAGLTCCSCAVLSSLCRNSPTVRSEETVPPYGPKEQSHRTVRRNSPTVRSEGTVPPYGPKEQPPSCATIRERFGIADDEVSSSTSNKVDRSPDGNGKLHSPHNITCRPVLIIAESEPPFIFFISQAHNSQKTCPPKFCVYSLMTTTLATNPHFTTLTTPTDLYKSHISSSCNTHPSYIPSPS
jgi:hypothetical protein